MPKPSDRPSPSEVLEDLLVLGIPELATADSIEKRYFAPGVQVPDDKMASLPAWGLMFWSEQRYRKNVLRLVASQSVPVGLRLSQREVDAITPLGAQKAVFSKLSDLVELRRSKGLTTVLARFAVRSPVAGLILMASAGVGASAMKHGAKQEYRRGMTAHPALEQWRQEVRPRKKDFSLSVSPSKWRWNWPSPAEQTPVQELPEGIGVDRQEPASAPQFGGHDEHAEENGIREEATGADQEPGRAWEAIKAALAEVYKGGTAESTSSEKQKDAWEEPRERAQRK
ncbi:Uu.00g098440.m01.CDS01 [Anthostomella pinea]|uniref:Uu.00g098440.m01.CDS01 n=1 Tax=Anthostomella pinea TaxID=933095 RepID=A0AAI8VDL1_9PEZI|nr:Uu.00g098440.m01.CDS01 [Anthostomella pinea]